jgi:D-alanyl-D-alanine carboxypeptidase (penicillin-binding protein 5/6)
MVLNGLSSIKARAEESQKLAEWAFREFDDYHVYKAGEILGEVPVTDGIAETVPMQTQKAVDLTLPRIAHNDMKQSVTHLDQITAPIKKGQEIGKAVISVPGHPDTVVPLVAAADVQPLGLWGKLRRKLGHLIGG